MWIVLIPIGAAVVGGVAYLLSQKKPAGNTAQPVPPSPSFTPASAGSAPVPFSAPSGGNTFIDNQTFPGMPQGQTEFIDSSGFSQPQIASNAAQAAAMVQADALNTIAQGGSGMGAAGMAFDVAQLGLGMLDDNDADGGTTGEF